MEFVLSGIPMTYDSAGTKYTFESGGMFDLGFTHRDEAIEPLKDKPITIDFRATTNDPTFNFYKLDTNIRNWTYLGKANNISQEKEESTPAMAYRPADQQKQAIIPLRRSMAEIEQRIAQHKTKEPILPSQPNKSNYRFHLDIVPAEFPELAHYKDLQFEIKRGYQTYNADIFKTNWTDIELKHLKKDQYLLSLFKNKEKHDFIISPVYEGAAYDSIKSIYHTAHQQYLNEQKRLKEEKKKLEERFLKIQQKSKIDAERYQREQIAIQATLDSAHKQATTFIQRYTILQSGIYNCDKAAYFDNRINIPYIIIDDNNKVLPVSYVYMAENSRNAVFDISSMIFPYKKKTKYFVFAIDKKGNMGYISKESLKDIAFNNNKKIHFLKFVPLSPEEVNPEQLNKIAGFKVMRKQKI